MAHAPTYFLLPLPQMKSLMGTSNADFIRIYAERSCHQAAHQLMTLNHAPTDFAPKIRQPESQNTTLSGSQMLGWFALAAALLLVLMAQYQGYPLLPMMKRKQQVWLSGLPIGARLSDGKHHFLATETQQEIEMSDWQTHCLQLDLPQQTDNIRLLLTVIRPKLGGSSTQHYEFVLDKHGGYEVWANQKPLTISRQQPFPVSGSQIHLNLSHIITNRQETDESWMRRAEQQLAKTWTQFKGK